MQVADSYCTDADLLMCAHIFPKPCEPAGRIFRGLRTLALSALRLTTLAKPQGGASQRPSALAGPLFVVCCWVGQAKVNGATYSERPRSGVQTFLARDVCP